MRIAIDGTSCQLLKDLLSQHQDGLSRLLWKKYDYQLPEKYRTDAAVPLLNQLDDDPKRLSINGHQRDLLLQLLAWAPQWNEPGTLRKLMSQLQPQGTPLGAEVGDHVVLKQSGLLVEIVLFYGGFYHAADEAEFVSDSTTDLTVCETIHPAEEADWQFFSCRLDDLMWPTELSAENVIWGPYPHRLAA